MRTAATLTLLLLSCFAPTLLALEPQDAASYRHSGGVTPQTAEQLLESMSSPLISDAEADHVNSYYYFGIHGDRTLIGLERVRGSDYRQYFSVLIFDGEQLLGYYQNVASLPLFIEDDGALSFPRGAELQDRIFLQQDTFPPLCLAAYPCVDWHSLVVESGADADANSEEETATSADNESEPNAPSAVGEIPPELRL